MNSLELRGDFSFEMDVALHRLQRQPDWDIEAALFDSKWWDYRLLHPAQATLLCVQAYSAAYKELVARRVDVNEATGRKGVRVSTSSFEKFAAHSEAMRFLNLRRTIDKLCMPYPFYIQTVLRHADQNGWRNHIPRPGHIQSRQFQVVALKAWKAELEARLILPDHVAYIEPESLDTLPHRRFQGWLCRRIEKRPNPDLALANYIYGLYSKPLILEEVARAHFDESVMIRASREARL